MIRRKTFDAAKFQKEWIVIVDGTQGYSGSRKINDACLERRHNKGTDEETVNYHNDILEAKICGPAKVEDRKPGIQQAEELERRYNTCLQLEHERIEKPLPDATDIGLYQTTL